MVLKFEVFDELHKLADSQVCDSGPYGPHLLMSTAKENMLTVKIQIYLLICSISLDAVECIVALDKELFFNQKNLYFPFILTKTYVVGTH